MGKWNTRLNPSWQRAEALREKGKEETRRLMRALQQIGQEKEMTTGSGRKSDEKGLFFTEQGKNDFEKSDSEREIQQQQQHFCNANGGSSLLVNWEWGRKLGMSTWVRSLLLRLRGVVGPSQNWMPTQWFVENGMRRKENLQPAPWCSVFWEALYAVNYVFHLQEKKLTCCLFKH